MLKKILGGLGVLLLGFLAFVATRSDEMEVSREIVVSAQPEVIFPYINESKKVDEWMPWKDSDPGVKMNYSGPEGGVGSKSSWDSSGKMGTGEALVTESSPNQSVTTQLTYTKPMTMSQTAQVSLTPDGPGTRVKWKVSGKKNFFFKLMGVFVDCDTMIGGEFEKGLKNLKTLVESKGASR